MQGIEITDAAIYNHASNPSSYQRGISYFNQGRVFDFYFDDKNSNVSASVEGNDFFYDVSVSLATSGSIASSSCECPAFKSYPGGCKHIIAVLKEAQKNLRYARKTPQRSSAAINNVFEYFSSFYEDQNKEPVNLEFSLNVEKEHYGAVNSLEIRVGTSRMYIIKNIKDFFVDITNGKAVEFGKNFTFDPSIHEFAAKDRQIVDLIYEIIENEYVKNTFHNYYNDTSSLFVTKRIYLTDPYLRRLLSNPENVFSNAIVYGYPFTNVRILESNLPVDMVLKQGDEDIFLEYSNKVRFIPLTKNYDYCFADGLIYHPSAIQRKNLIPFIQAFERSSKSSIAIPKNDISRFVSEVLPFLHKAADVSIDASLSDKFHKAELRTEVYFDRYEDGISARIEFHYGDDVIIPFTPGDKSKDGDMIIVRNPENEMKILNYFEKYEFKVEKEKVYLLEEEKIYDFVYNTLSPLQEIADVYYSDSFKNLKVNNIISFSGGIKLTDDSLLEFSFDYEGITPEELSEIFTSLHEKKKYYRLKNGSFLPLDRPELVSIGKLANKLDIDLTDIEGKVIQLPKYRALYLDSLIRDANISGIERNLAFKQMVQSIREPGDMDFKVPSKLKSILRDYQKTGFKWLKSLSSYGFGGILADDMGLGKTLQVISFVLSEKGVNFKPALVVAPTSLIFNWQDEVKKFVPDMKVSVISGVQSERREQLNEISVSDIVVTSYALMRHDINLYSNMEFSYCFLDEAQHIKNPGTINARSVKQIKAGGYFALTGTPIENTLTELWSIFDFIMPGYLLSHKEFVSKYENPIIKNQDSDALHDLSRHIKPFILRRMKKDVLKELPEKIESTMTANMTSRQRKLYLAYLGNVKKEIATELEVNGFERSHIKILAALTRLRQICCHPSLFLEDYEGESGKMSLLMEVLKDAVESGHRILVFSQFTSMLHLISGELDNESIEYYYLDGSIKAESRGLMVTAFNSGSRSVFLISLKAGGTGLNLTGADMVIHYDPWWNPAVEDQASDRAYRIGQNNVVQVIKLITQGTIEEKIYELQKKKRAMVDAVIQPGETLLTKLTESEIRGLFDLD